jgi:hypothetical protein
MNDCQLTRNNAPQKSKTHDSGAKIAPLYHSLERKTGLLNGTSAG